jgi:predicted nucleic-acid-binding protein
MIGLDTNILVRYLAQDDPVQSPRATHIMERRLTEARPGFISLVTMTETVWVLDQIYGLSTDEIVTAVERILGADALLVQNEHEVFAAIVSFKTGAGSFPDALIGAIGEWAGCTTTLTFDKKATRMKAFQLAYERPSRKSAN